MLRKALALALCLAPTIATAQWGSQGEAQNPSLYQQQMLQAQQERNRIMRQDQRHYGPDFNTPLLERRQPEHHADPSDVLLEDFYRKQYRDMTGR